jgi:hypothetical protein
MQPIRKAQDNDPDLAAHLLRRSGFGGRPDEIRAVTGRGIRRFVDQMIEEAHGDDRDDPPGRFMSDSPWPDRQEFRRLRSELTPEERRERRQQRRRDDREQFRDLVNWWIRRAILTSCPFREKMTFFWHNYFATSYRGVQRTDLMHRQNELFRKNALRDFRELLFEAARDPAMIIWLDNRSNRKEQPNENFAREVMELFSVGPGHYTEIDIKEAARAFTGWTIRDGEFYFNERAHDEGVKVFMGASGNFGGEHILQFLMRHSAMPTYLSKRLLQFFVVEEPTKPLITAVASELRRNQFDIGATMQTLFKSRLFYDPGVRFSLIKSPVDLVVGTFRLLETPPPDFKGLRRAMNLMGQIVMMPPNVGGWPHGRGWINTSALLSRYNFSLWALTAGRRKFGRRKDRMDGEEQERRAGLDSQLPKLLSAIRPDGSQANDAEYAVDGFSHLFLQRPVDGRRREKLLGILGSGFSLDRRHSAHRMLRLLHVLMSTPEYQLA